MGFLMRAGDAGARPNRISQRLVLLAMVLSISSSSVQVHGRGLGSIIQLRDWLLNSGTSSTQDTGQPVTGGIPVGVLTCEGEEAAEQADAFWSRPLRECSCPPHLWMERLQGMSPAGNKLIIDIGCNLGFTSAEAFDVWAPELGINKRTLLHAHTPVNETADLALCGGCVGDCASLHQTPTLLMGHRRVEVHCVEPGNLHWARLIQARQALFGGGPGQSVSIQKRAGNALGVWHLHNFAMSNTTGTSMFTPDCNNTRCHLSFASNDASPYVVQVTTVDRLLEKIGSPSHVTFLKIDTEGFDALVLQGAEQALRSKVFQVLLFEYHGINMWTLLQLKDTVNWLEGLGYVCYYEGKHHLFKLSRTCWHPSYEIHRWTNVVCGLAGGPMELMLDGFSWLRALKTHAVTPSVI